MEEKKVEENLAIFNIPSSQNLYFIEEDIRNQMTHDYDDDDKQERRLVEELEKIIGYKFKSPNLLCEAFTHSSFQENCKSYERLELLGDSILNMLITKEKFFNYPYLPPGKLTKLRAANVDNEKLARVAVKYNLHNFLRHKKPLLKKQVEEFREAILEYPLHSLGLIDPPKALADIVESLIGAIFIDSNCMNTTWQVVKVLLQPLITPEKLEDNPVTKLYELCQKNGLKTKFIDQWEKTREVEVYVDEKFVGKGKSCGKKITAKNKAAHNAYYRVIRNLSVKATMYSLEANNVEQLKRDARAFLNVKRTRNQMDEASSTKELAFTNLNASKLVENATVEIDNNAINFINASNVELGKQLTQNRGATSDKSYLATTVALESVAHTLSVVKETSITNLRQNIIAIGDDKVAENLELRKANFVGRGIDEQRRPTIDESINLLAEKCYNEEDNKANNWTFVTHTNVVDSHMGSTTSQGTKNSTTTKMRNEQIGQLNNDMIQIIDKVSSKSKTWAEQAEDEEYQNNGSKRESL